MPSSSTARDASSSAVCSTRRRGGLRFIRVDVSKCRVRRVRTPGGSTIRRRWSTTTSIASLSAPAASPCARAAELTSRAAGQCTSTAAQARWSHVGGPVCVTYTPSWRLAHSRRRTRRAMSWSWPPAASTWRRATTPAWRPSSFWSRSSSTVSTVDDRAVGVERPTSGLWRRAGRKTRTERRRSSPDLSGRGPARRTRRHRGGGVRRSRSSVRRPRSRLRSSYDGGATARGGGRRRTSGPRSPSRHRG